MLPFVHYLPARDADAADRRCGPYLPAIKCIAAPLRLGMNSSEICIDGGTGRCVSAEALKLRVMPVAFCPPAQNGLREQRLAPQGNQALCIQIAGMNRPKTH